jgi:hypothetical protein
MTSIAAPLPPPTTVDVEVGEPELLLKLTGPNGAHLRALGEEFRVTLGQRGTTLRIHGAPADVADMERTLVQLLDVLGDRNLTSLELARAARTLRTHPQVNLRRLFDDVVDDRCRGAAPSRPRGSRSSSICRPSANTTWSSAWARPARARPTSPWPWPCARCSRSA